MTFTLTKLQISDVLLVEPKSFSDERGYFFENFKESEFHSIGITTRFVQDNISHSSYGVLRGLHYQLVPKSQAKLVTCITGEIFDVAVDIRKNSSTYGKWVSQVLSEENHRSLYIPEGFAHGFCVKSDAADILYKVSTEYSPENERGIIWNDSTLNISWPVENPSLSTKDAQLPTLENSDNDF